jgi:trehalose 6-phosphate synthase/phosphatase
MKKLDKGRSESIKSAYDAAGERLIFLDYDGTLVPFAAQPERALPGAGIIRLLDKLSAKPQNTVVIISGRDKAFLERIFGDMNVTLVAEHGYFVRKPGMPWKALSLIENRWKSDVYNVLIRFTSMFQGSFIEEKETAIAWHYRNCVIQPTPVLIETARSAIRQVTDGFNIEMLEGKKVVEVRQKTVNKGTTAVSLLQEISPDFILALGDDLTDEILFSALPESAVTIKVGVGSSVAKYSCPGQENVADFLGLLLGKIA